MRVDRIAAFAEAMVPSLAGVAGESIHRLGKVEATRRQIVIDSLFETFRDQHRETAHRLLAEAFPSTDPLSGEAAAIADLSDPFRVLCCAGNRCSLETRSVGWDHRQSHQSRNE